MPARSAPARSPRIPSLDAARALGVVAMVVGHTLDAVVALSARDGAVLAAYWKARGLTAPVFMAAAGWAVTAAVGRGAARGLAIPAGRLPRVALLLAVGYALRWPGWGTDLLRAGDPSVWAHLLAFDALHAIAISLLAAALVLALPWTPREKAGAFALLAVVSVALGMRAPAPVSPAPAALPAPPLAMALAQAAGGTSPFPIFPWAGYFFVGAIVGLLARDAAGRRAAAMGALGAALVAATCWTGVGTMPAGHPVLFAFRAGAVLVLFAALSALPRALAARCAPLGRASLGVYVAHVPMVYGWSTWHGLAQRVGPALSPLDAAAVAAAVLVASLTARHVAAALAAAARAGLAAVRERLDGALAGDGAGRGRAAP
ncbi:MAG TPA: heparan-alpha-glucosaminide N-acetyltransferase domain-containing protein [Anaeromyxobacter sp.]|nr:heparan-alpha-glucosaminide N-acetyltransferase domain-containing protein [Anaeromyxobacter sp.]